MLLQGLCVQQEQFHPPSQLRSTGPTIGHKYQFVLSIGESEIIITLNQAGPESERKDGDTGKVFSNSFLFLLVNIRIISFFQIKKS